MFRIVAASLLLAAGICLAAEPGAGKDGFEDLLAGNTLAGWDKVGAAKWAVENGVLAGGPGGGTLMHKASLTDYVFECELNLAKGQNGGVFLRVPRRPPRRSLSPRYEIQIWDSPKAVGHRTGDLLYVHMCRQWASKPGEWNQLRLTSVGPRHEIVLNGTRILDAVHFGQLEGHLGFQAHSRNKAPYIWFRNVRLRRLAKGVWPHPSTLPRVLVLLSAGRRPADPQDRIGCAIENALVATGLYDVTWAADPRVLDPPHVDGYDAIILHGPDAKGRTRWLNAARRERIAKRLEAGRGLIVLHSAFTGGPDDWPGFRKLAGGSWFADDKPAQASLRIAHAGGKHPILDGVDPFDIRDAIYRAPSPEPTATRLLGCEQLGKADTIAWCIQSGRGRVFCCSLGGSEGAIAHKALARLIANACQWVCPKPAPEEK